MSSNYPIIQRAGTTPTAGDITTNVGSFGNILGAGDVDVQTALDTIDDMLFTDISDTIASYTANRILYEGAAAVTDSANLTFDGALLNIGASTGVSSILDEDTMTSDSATALATQQSIKAYVDTSVAGIVDGLSYQGTWNASTNTPTIVSSTGTQGYYYVVSVDGSTTIDGESDWVVGDWIIFNGATWQKLDNTDQVSSVFGRAGVVVATTNDYTWAQIDKTTSSIADITTRNHTDLTAGDGSDHTFINQDVTTTGTPSFTSVTGTLTGTSILADGVTGTTQTASDNSTKIATTAYVDAAHAIAPGNDTEVIFNDGGSLGSDLNLTYDKATGILSSKLITLDTIGGVLKLSGPTTESLLINSGSSSMTGIENFSLGSQSLINCTSGQRNIAIGRASMYSATNSSYNVAIGRSAMYSGILLQENVAIGSSSLTSSLYGKYNTAIGVSSLYSALGDDNVGIGHKAGRLVTGAGNVLIGTSAAETQTAISNQLWIANNSTATPLIYGEFDNNLVKINGTIGSPKKDVTLGAAATTFAVTSNVITITGDTGSNTISTITSGVDGQLLTLIFVDALITITDTVAATADTVNLSAAFTSAANTTLQLVYDGNKWFETSRSVN